MLQLIRTEDDGTSLIGTLNFDSQLRPLFSIERSWKSEYKPIPAGIYNLVPHNGLKYRNVFALVNSALGVTHFVPSLTHPNPRTAILVHPANFARELRGCIALGMVRHTLRDPKSDFEIVDIVGRSREAVKIFTDYVRKLKPSERKLEIIERASVRNFRSRL